MNRRIIAVATLMLLVVMSLASCSDNDEDKTAGKVRQLTVVFSTGGLGDNGYNDKIMQGVMNFAGSHTDVETHIIRPHTLDEAREIYRNWLSYAANSNDSSLIVFASSEYSEVVRAESAPQGQQQGDALGFNMPIEAYSRVDSIYINDKPEEGKLPLWASVRSFSHVYSVAGGSNGSLTGYAAGLKRKQGLLDIERG